MNTNEAFEMVLDKLIDVAADKRLIEESRADLRAKMNALEMKLATTERALAGKQQVYEVTFANYEKLKAAVPPDLLAEHERAIDEIPF